jgi:hypothetical protein
MRSLLDRVKNLLIRPAAEWQAIRNEPAAYITILVRTVLPLAAIPPLASIAGRILLDRSIPDSALSSSTSYVLVTNLVWYGMYVVNIVITGIVIAAVLGAADSRWSGIRGFTIAAYSFTPLSLAGLFAVIPSLGWTLYSAILYGIYLLYLGITLLADVPKTKAALYALSSFLGAAVIVGVMNLSEYMFESFVARKLFL